MSAHRRELGVRKSYWWIHRLAPNLTPASTGSASWCVRVRHRDRDGVRVRDRVSASTTSWCVCSSGSSTSLSRSEGQSTALPLLGSTVIPRSLKRVPPPASGVVKYMKNV